MSQIHLPQQRTDDHGNSSLPIKHSKDGVLHRGAAKAPLCAALHLLWGYVGPQQPHTAPLTTLPQARLRHPKR